MEDRAAVTANMVLAARIASDLNAKIVGWCAISSLTGRIRLKDEVEDLDVIARQFNVPWDYLQPRLRLKSLSLQNIAVLLRMMILAICSPRVLSHFVFGGVPLGQNAADSQRRRTLRLTASPFVFIAGEGKFPKYPQVALSRWRLTNLFALSLPRFAVRTWLSWTFWRLYLGEHSVVFSVQSHTERGEFGPLTQLLSQNETPIILQLERLELWDSNQKRLTNLGRAWLERQSISTKKRLFNEAMRNLRKSLSEKADVSRIYAETHRGTQEANERLQQKISEFLEGAPCCLVVVLPATFEAFNHDRVNKVFFNYRDWFASINQVASKTGQKVVLKVHPAGDISEVHQVARAARRCFTDGSWWIAPRFSSISALAAFREKLVVTSLSSSSTIECGILRLPVVLADVSAYAWWDFAKAPHSVVDYENRLMNATATELLVDFNQLGEALLLTNHHRNWYAPLKTLVSGPPQRDLNSRVHQSNSTYARSSFKRLLCVGILEDAYHKAGVWQRLAHAYQPPALYTSHLDG
jgi:hypothetical protein